MCWPLRRLIAHSLLTLPMASMEVRTGCVQEAVSFLLTFDFVLFSSEHGKAAGPEVEEDRITACSC